MCLLTEYFELSPALYANVPSYTRGRTLCPSWRVWASLYSEKVALKITSLEGPTTKKKGRERNIQDYGSSSLKCLDEGSCFSPSPDLQDGDGVGGVGNRKGMP